MTRGSGQVDESATRAAPLCTSFHDSRQGLSLKRPQRTTRPLCQAFSATSFVHGLRRTGALALGLATTGARIFKTYWPGCQALNEGDEVTVSRCRGWRIERAPIYQDVRRRKILIMTRPGR